MLVNKFKVYHYVLLVQTCTEVTSLLGLRFFVEERNRLLVSLTCPFLISHTGQFVCGSRFEDLSKSDDKAASLMCRKFATSVKIFNLYAVRFCIFRSSKIIRSWQNWRILEYFNRKKERRKKKKREFNISESHCIELYSCIYRMEYVIQYCARCDFIWDIVYVLFRVVLCLFILSIRK